MNIILASASPRRKQLLEYAGVCCIVQPAHINETPLPNEQPIAYVQRLSQHKAATVARMIVNPQQSIVAADTIVCLGNQLFGKPNNQQDAFDTWQALSAKTHQVITSVSIINVDKGFEHTFYTTTYVTFAQLSREQMQWYWDSNEPQDKAGAYAIQGLGGQFVIAIEGSYTSVVGLPLYETLRILNELHQHD